MSKAARGSGAVVLLALSTLCLFGFLATFEPLDESTQLAWRAGYGLAGLACLGGLVALLRPRRRNP